MALHIVSDVSEVIVSNSLCQQCGRKRSDNHPILFNQNGAGAQFKCIGNMFEDCVNHPIFERNPLAFVARTARIVAVQHNQYVVKNNKLKGNDKFDNKTIDANTVYKYF